VAWGRVAKSATFGVKWASDESFCPSMVPAIQKGDLAVQRVLHVALQNLITKIFFCL